MENETTKMEILHEPNAIEIVNPNSINGLATKLKISIFKDY